MNVNSARDPPVFEFVMVPPVYRRFVLLVCQTPVGYVASVCWNRRITGGGVGSVTDDGVVTIMGSATTVGTAVTVVMTPSLASDRVIWSCSTGGTVSSFKYVPAECRH